MAANATAQNLADIPICVDLDGSLLKSDLLFECAVAVLRQSPKKLPLILWSLLKGKAALKLALARAIELDVVTLPWRQDLLDYLCSEKAKGRTLALTTGANELLAQKVALYFGIFDHVFASSPTENLIGKLKASRLLEEFGEKQFDYVGNDSADLAVWSKSRRQIVVGSESFCKKLKAKYPGSLAFETKTSLKAYRSLIRIHQWAKNILLLVPMTLAFAFSNATTVSLGLLAFVSFSLTASSIYILNDIWDLSDDRKHPEKKNRPIASGDISIGKAFFSACMLLISGLALGEFIAPAFLILLIVYVVMNFIYSVWAKRLLLADVIVLASFFSLRLFSGSVATETPVSEWLLIFSLFMFMSLALLKRVSELASLRKAGIDKKSRTYEQGDLGTLVVLSAASGFSALVVFLLYIQSQQSHNIYSSPDTLYLLFPVMAYWLSRIIIVANRGGMSSDPVVFALKDRATIVVGAVVAAIIFFAK